MGFYTQTGSTTTSHANLAPAGMQYYGYRYNDPVTGRWPSRDSKNAVGSLKWFEAQSAFIALRKEVEHIRDSLLNRMFAASPSAAAKIAPYLDEFVREETTLLRNDLNHGDLEDILNLYAFVRNSPTDLYDILGLASGGKPKRNLDCEGFTKKSDPGKIAKALADAVKNNQKARARALRALLKVVKRGGRFCVPIQAFINAFEQTFGTIGGDDPDPFDPHQFGDNLNPPSPSQCCCIDDENTTGGVGSS